MLKQFSIDDHILYDFQRQVQINGTTFIIRLFFKDEEQWYMIIYSREKKELLRTPCVIGTDLTRGRLANIPELAENLANIGFVRDIGSGGIGKEDFKNQSVKLVFRER